MDFWYFCRRNDKIIPLGLPNNQNTLRMKSDIEIARETVLKPITEVANTVGIAADKLEHYGKYIAKVPLECFDES